MRNLIIFALVAVAVLPFLTMDIFSEPTFVEQSGAPSDSENTGFGLANYNHEYFEVNSRHAPAIATPDGMFFVYQDGNEDDGTDPFSLIFANTTDATSFDRTTISTINTSGFDYDYVNIQLHKVTDSEFHVFFQEESGGGGGDTETYHSYTTNGGTSFSTPALVNGTSTNLLGFHSFVDSSSNLYVFASVSDLGEEMFFMVSDDFGSSWDSVIVSDDSDTTADEVEYEDYTFDFIVDGTTVHAIWVEFEDASADLRTYYAKSTDSGETFGTPFELGDEIDTRDSGYVKILQDTDDTDDLIAIWGEGGSGDLVQQLSDDDGATWGSTTTIVDETHHDTECDYQYHDGVIYIICEDSSPNDLEFFKSSDFGGTWTTPTSVGVYDSGETVTAPSLTIVEETEGTYFYACYYQDDGFDVARCNESTDFGANWSSAFDVGNIAPQATDQVHISNFAIHEANPLNHYYLEENTGSSSDEDFSIFVGTPTFIADQFGDPINLSQSDPDSSEFYRNSNGRDPQSGQAYGFVDGEKIHFIFADERDSDGEYELMYNFFNAQTNSTGTPVEIDEVLNGFGYEYWQKAIWADGNTIDVLFNEDIGNSDTDTFHTRSTDGGSNWSTPVTVWSENAQQINMFVDDDTIDVFIDDADNDITYFIRSTNGGSSFATEVLITSPPVSTDNDFITDIVKVSTSEYHVLYLGQQTSDGTNDLYYTNSTDGGSTWTDEVTIYDATGTEDVIGGQLFIDDGDPDEMLVIWSLNNGVGTQYIYQDSSSNGGATFTEQDDELSDSGSTDCTGQTVRHQSSDEQSNLQSARSGDNIYLICVSDNQELVWDRTEDFGQNWVNGGLDSFDSDDLPNDIDSETFEMAQVHATGDNLYIAFQAQNSFTDNEFHVMQSNTKGASWANSVALAFETNPDIREWSSILVTDAGTVNIVALNQDGTNDRDLFVFSTTTSSNAVPVITLTGANPQQINHNSSYSELGASCIDPEEGDISGNLVIDATGVDVNTVGSYQVTYDCQDAGGADAVQVIRDVDVVDADAPIITLIGDNPMEVLVGSTYIEPEATCIDAVEGDISGNLVIGGDVVDTSSTGTFEVTYDCDDSESNSATQVTREVNVVNQGGGAGTSGSANNFPVSNPIGGGTEGIPDELQALFDQQLEDLLNTIPPTEGTFVQTIVQTFFEFQVLDTELDNLTLQSFVQSQALPIRWSSGDDIVVTEIDDAVSPFLFTFESVPSKKSGSGGVISNNNVIYSVEVPRNECSTLITSNCVEKLRYEVPITVNAVINNTAVTATGSITIDLTEEGIDPIVVILASLASIPIVAGIIWSIRGGNNPTKVRDLTG